MKSFKTGTLFIFLFIIFSGMLITLTDEFRNDRIFGDCFDGFTQKPVPSMKQDWVLIWEDNNTEIGKDVAIDTNGNIYLAGIANNDSFLIKYNNSRNYEWNRTWGGQFIDSSEAIGLDSSNNIYLSGYSKSFGSQDVDVVLLKYNSSGFLQWNRTWGGQYDDLAHDIALDTENNAYIVGETNGTSSSGDIFILKYNISGDYQWNKTWDGGLIDKAFGFVLDADNNLYITGITNYSGKDTDADVVLLKYDLDGNYLWNRTIESKSDYWAYSIVLDSNNNSYITGSTNDTINNSYNMFLMKFNSTGNLEWNSTWGGSLDEMALDISLDLDDHIVLIGDTKSYGDTNGDISIVKFSTSGSYLNHEIWGTNNRDSGLGLAIENQTNNYYITGFTNSTSENKEDLLLLRYSQLPGTFTLSPNKTYSIPNNRTFISWTISSDAINYSLYSKIIDAGSSWILIEDGLVNNSFAVSSQYDKSYYYKIISWNKYGCTESNQIEVDYTRICTLPAWNAFLFFSSGIIIAVIIVIVFGMSLSYQRKKWSKTHKRTPYRPSSSISYRNNNKNPLISKGVPKNIKTLSSKELIRAYIEKNSSGKGKEDMDSKEYTLLSSEFHSRVDKFNWKDIDEKLDFIKEMISLTPEEREATIDYMIKKSNKNEYSK